MKKLISILLIVMLCLSFTGCGKKETPQENHEFVINTQLISEHTEAYLNSQPYLDAVSEYETQMNSKNGGALLRKAVEYHLDDFEGFSIHAVLLQFKTDVAYGEGMISDTALVCIDLTSGEITDNLSPEFDEYSNSFNGTFQSNDQLRIIIMNAFFGNDLNTPVLFHDKEQKKALSSDEITAVNETLGLTYRRYQSAEDADAGIDEIGNPVISTNSQERIQKVIEMAEFFKQTPLYQELAVDSTTIRVGAATEYKNDDFASGYPVHILMLHADRIDTEHYGFTSGTMLMDMNTGAMYTYTDFDFSNMPDFNSLASVEDAYPWCMLSYENVLFGAETQLWASMGETMIHLTEEELSSVNEILDSAAAVNSAEQDALRQEAAKNLTEQQKTFFDAAVEFSNTPRYKESSKNPASISLAAAAEYHFVHPDNGFTLNVLLMQAENVDVDMYGFTAGTFLKDLTTGKGCTDTFMDLSNWAWDWEDYSDINNVYAACILSYEQVVNNNEQHIIMVEACDKLTPLKKADLDAINAALNP